MSDAFIGIEAVFVMGFLMAMYLAHHDKKTYTAKYTSRNWKKGKI